MIYVTNLSTRDPGYVSHPVVSVLHDESKRTYGEYVRDHLADLRVTEPGTYNLLWHDTDRNHAQVVELVVELERVPLKIIRASSTGKELR